MRPFGRILLIRLGGIGDITFTIPAVQLIRQNYPDAKLTFLTSKSFAPLLEGIPGIDRVLTIDRDRFRQRNFSLICRELTSLLRQLRQGHFDLVVDLQGFGETVLLAWLSGARTRWGLVRKPWRGRFFTFGMDRFQTTHPADQHRELLINAGLQNYPIGFAYFLPEKWTEAARQLFIKFGYRTDRPTLFIQPFSNYEHKNWPLSNYLELATYCQERGIQVIFGGGPADHARLEAVTGRFPVTAGRAGILLNAGLMSLSTVMVGGDTGMLHLAVAMGQRVVMLMNSPETFGPYQHLGWALVPDPAGSGLNRLAVSEVIAATEKAISEKP